jgi:hypothetical protein
MKIDQEYFNKIFESRFWKKLKDSIVPFEDNPNKQDFLKQLYDEITLFTYNPSTPREYIVINKNNGISRYVPTFNRKDYCVYFLCIKLLENDIAINKVEGTFGGWTLGNPIRLKEEQEIIEIEYVPYNTLNELSWIQAWQSFQHIVRTFRDIQRWNYFVKIDIANFYDCINLSILERKIRHIIHKSKQDVVSLLFHFLRNWNKKLEGYNQKTVGIPQDEIGDCSRLLANFYLQDYDLKLKSVCDQLGAKYVRFADDQIIYANSIDDIKSLLFEASRELLRINLHLNSSKVIYFRSVNDFNEYWSFEIYDLLKNENDSDNINKAVKKYLQNIENKVLFRESSVLKRLLRVDFKYIMPEYRHQLLSMFFNPEFLSELNFWLFSKIREKINSDVELYCILDDLIDKVLFNGYHYNLLAFYKKYRPTNDNQRLINRIAQLKL